MIKGRVEDIVFRNAENGYTVAIIDTDVEIVTAVGIFPPVTEGEIVELVGNKTVSKYGEQLSVTEVKISPPNTTYDIVRYLSSGLFSGIGEITAERIVEKFGVDTLEIMAKMPHKLAEVKGISEKRALAIAESMLETREMQQTILYLQKLEISVNLAIKIYKFYGAQTRFIIESNPYRLVENIDGIGFITADKIAKSIGVGEDSEFRISAGILYTLKQAVNKNGDTFMPKEKLCVEVRKLLSIEVSDEQIDSKLMDMEVSGKVVIVQKEGENIMLSTHYMAEQAIAARLCALCAYDNTLHIDIDADIANYEKLNNLTLHEAQISAIKTSIENGVTVITGGPGTGKTTIIKCIIAVFKQRGLNVQLCAPTGRAAKRLSEASGEEAKTIHRLLDLDFKGGKGYFTFNENTKLPADVVIIDEVSMCDEYVFKSLLSALRYGARLIMVGDKDQLPSVGAGNVLADIINCGIIPISFLTEIYRQGTQSLIVKNAHLINKGEMPIVENTQESDFFFSNKPSSGVLQETVDMVTKRISAFKGVSSKDIQVLCPMKKGECGVLNLNERLQHEINPPAKDKGEIVCGKTVFRMGDKVIHTMNNYQMEWVKDEGGSTSAGRGVFNGDIGFIIAVDRAAMTLKVAFDDGKVATYSAGEFDQISLAYAVSVHKSQGSEFDVVVIVLSAGNFLIMTRNLLYTALTRAKKMAVIIGDKDVVYKMVKNNYTTRRFTMLEDFIKAEAKRVQIV